MTETIRRGWVGITVSLSGFSVPLADMESMAANIRLKIPNGVRVRSGIEIFQRVAARIRESPTASTKEAAALWNMRGDNQLPDFVMTKNNRRRWVGSTVGLSGFSVPLADMEPIAANIRLKIPVGIRTGSGVDIFQSVSAIIHKSPRSPRERRRRSGT
ncbi:hypothetical protein ACFL6S_32290 [Candidatus Poribacteria bacterium]